MNFCRLFIKKITLRIIPMVLLCVVVINTSGDIIHLKTGGRVEGKIITRTETQIIVDVGFGEMEVDTSEIARIEWDDSDKQAEIEKGWKSFDQAMEPQKKDTAEPVVKKETAATSSKDKSIAGAASAKKDTVPESGKTKRTAASPVKKEQGIRQSISFQTSFARAGTFAVGLASRNKKILDKSGIAKEKIATIPEQVEIGIYYPTMFTLDKRWPLFIAMGPGIETGIAEINAYVKYADKLGFIVAAPELPPESDNEISRYYYTLHLIEYLKEEGHINGKPVLIGGFDDGARWALHVGTSSGNLYSGILAIGCKEDGASPGYTQMPHDDALHVPIYLLSGTKDKEAGPESKSYSNMIESIKKTGFSQIKEVSHTGGHVIPVKETTEAFKQLMNGTH